MNREPIYTLTLACGHIQNCLGVPPDNFKCPFCGENSVVLSSVKLKET